MGKRFSAAAYDLPPASQMRCNDFLRACGIYVLLCMERAKGIEPSTYSLGSCRSTTELRPRSEGQPRSRRITRMRDGEKQAPQALWRCGASALRLRRSPTASAAGAYACSHV